MDDPDECFDQHTVLVELPEVEPEEVDEPEPIVVTQEEFQSLPIDPGELSVQPDRGWVLINVDTVVWSGASEHVMNTTVLGVDVEVRASPVNFTWNFGDGDTPLTTTDSGAPWPNGSISHAYEHGGEVTITLDVEWQGEFRIAGASQWLPVAGTALTQQSLDPLDVRSSSPRLVAPNGSSG